MGQVKARWSGAAAALLALMAGAVALTTSGCGGGSRPAKSVVIWWAQWDPATGLQELGTQFEKETGIKVIVHQIPWSSYQDQVFLNFGNPQTDFDIVVGDSQWIGRGATKGLYLDLTDWLPKAVDVKSVHPAALRYLCEYPAGTAHYFAAPCETDAVGFAYRKDWFEDPAEQAAFRKTYKKPLRVPETWDDFKRVAAFFTRPPQNRFGCALLTGREYDSLTMGWQQLLWGWGGSWGDERTFKVRGKLDTPAAVKSLEFYKGLVAFSPKGGTNFSYGNTLEAFTNGSTAMAMNYFAFFPAIAKQMGEKAGFMLVPKKGAKRVVSLGGQGFSISAKTAPERQEMAKRFIAWFLTPEHQQLWITKPAGFTASLKLLRSKTFAAGAPYNAAFAGSLDAMRDFWNVPPYNELLAASEKRLGEALDGVATPKDALKTLAAEHEKILADAGLAAPKGASKPARKAVRKHQKKK